MQQKALEYKQIRTFASQLPNNGKDLLINTPITENQVANFNFDYQLSFLESFVQQQISEGKQAYDQKKSQNEMGMDVGTTNASGGLKYGAYDAPSTGFYKSSAALQESNPLFQQPEAVKS